jgi:hypothetical protein
VLALLALGIGSSRANETPEAADSSAPWWHTVTPDQLPAPTTPVEQVIDRFVDANLKRLEVTAAPEADRPTLLRRVTLDLNSRLPTPVEAREFLSIDSPSQYPDFVDSRINDPAFDRYLAHELNWLLMDGQSTDFQKYLQRVIPEGKRWNEIFAEAVTGIADEEADKGRHGVDHFLRTRARDLDKMTNDVSVRFFGVNVSCAQCHDHPYVKDWSMDTYYGMKSFFGRTFENGGFVGERSYGTVSYKNADNEEVQATLHFLGGPQIPAPEEIPLNEEQKKAEKALLEQLRKDKKAPPATENSLREILALQGLEPGSEGEGYLARSLVNRLWHQYFGRGLVMPLDQMHGANEPSHPELLAWLARDLVTHDFDIKRLVRGMVLSQSYRRSSRWDHSDERRPHDRHFATAKVRPLNPRQYGVALRLATQDPSRLQQLAEQSKPREADIHPLTQQLDSIENSGVGIARWFERPGETFNVSVDEALLMTNSADPQNQLLSSGLVTHIDSLGSDEEKIRVAYRSTLIREPSEEELSLMQDYLNERQDRPKEGVRQMVWALLTCSESRFNF